MLAKPDSALVIVGHGSTINPDSSAPTQAHADRIRNQGIFREVLCAFWKEEPSLREILRMVESPTIYIVPNFISEGYFTEKVIPRELELTGRVTSRGQQTIYYCDPVGNDPRMTDLLVRKAAEVAPAVDPAQASLLIVGHGTGLNENSAVAAKRQVARIRERDVYREVLAAYMEEEPLVSNWQKLASQPRVIVVPFFISDGLHSYEDIPVLLGIASASTGGAGQEQIFRQDPYRIADRELYYASAIGTDPMFADVILATVSRFDSARSPEKAA
ncbi:MAG: cobalamin biosynthesis protein CbiX [Verrucomicrobia bacterium]|nr:cobalamin biosynthesis protein CbiX [Verrucomicrobiota bacterium]